MITALLTYGLIAYCLTFMVLYRKRHLPVFYEDGLPRYITLVEINAFAFLGPILIWPLFFFSFTNIVDDWIYSDNYNTGIM